MLYLNVHFDFASLSSAPASHSSQLGSEPPQGVKKNNKIIKKKMGLRNRKKIWKRLKKKPEKL